MSVSAELLCSFELLKPLDSAALKNHIKKGRNKRNSILNSPVSTYNLEMDAAHTNEYSLRLYLRRVIKREWIEALSDNAYSDPLMMPTGSVLDAREFWANMPTFPSAIITNAVAY